MGLFLPDSAAWGKLMSAVEAIYQGGVFKPLGEVRLPENQRVFLSIQMPTGQDAAAWLKEVREFQERIIAERGCFPDSTPDIAADRVRDD
jgi:predicted DNA-binding antitoxin AbrB/MazE fold protein